MNEFKTWLWGVFVELCYSCIAVAAVVGILWGFIIIIKLFA